jgi:Fe-S-cluster containining protein
LNGDSKIAEKSQTSCIHCGKCCISGGPALHIDDKWLVEKKRIPLDRLFTIRQGEPAWDNVKSQFIWASSDIIKIKGKGSSWECTYYDNDAKRCTIYDDRPNECGVFKCWDPSETEAVYGKNYLSRADLLSSVEGLWDLIVEHQEQCSFEPIKQMIKENPDPLVLPQNKLIRNMIKYDTVTRTKTIDLVKINPEWIDFLFGQPVSTIIQRMITHKPT